MSAETITSRDLTQHLERVAVDSGVVAANRARSVLFTAYKWLLDTHRLERDDNPVARARRWKERGRRRRAPTLEELGAIWRAAGEVQPEHLRRRRQAADLDCGAERAKSALLTWDEVDLDRAEITLPPARVKIDQPFWMPLSAPAVRILRDLPERRGPRLFPVISWARCKRALDEASGVDGWTLHDLRRSFSLAGARQAARRFRRRRARPGTHPGGRQGALRFQRAQAAAARAGRGMGAAGAGAAGEPVDRARALRVVEGGR